MRAIWKFTLQPPAAATSMPTTVIEMPEGAQILTVQVQHGQPCIWAVVDVNAPKRKYEFWIWPTGGQTDTPPLMAKEYYVGTFQLENGTLVFHVFCRGWHHEN